MKATFAAGCFWGIEAAFRAIPGVLDTMVGYSGGHTDNPTYQRVCNGNTGHAEAVQIEYDPDEVSYDDLLEVFWEIHDPTTLNRQGPDIGSQYRSAIFTHSPEQNAAALSSKRQQEATGRKIVTQITNAGPFYRAEEYHQRYVDKHGKCGI